MIPAHLFTAIARHLDGSNLSSLLQVNKEIFEDNQALFQAKVRQTFFERLESLIDAFFKLDMYGHQSYQGGIVIVVDKATLPPIIRKRNNIIVYRNTEYSNTSDLVGVIKNDVAAKSLSVYVTNKTLMHKCLNKIYSLANPTMKENMHEVIRCYNIKKILNILVWIKDYKNTTKYSLQKSLQSMSFLIMQERLYNIYNALTDPDWDFKRTLQSEYPSPITTLDLDKTIEKLIHTLKTKYDFHETEDPHNTLNEIVSRHIRQLLI